MMLAIEAKTASGSSSGKLSTDPIVERLTGRAAKSLCFTGEKLSEEHGQVWGAARL